MNTKNRRNPHGCAIRRARRERRRRVVLAVMIVLAIVVVGYGQHWALTEGPSADLNYTAASAAAHALVDYLN